MYSCCSHNTYLSLTVCSREDFTLILDLPEGTHEYKFFVDGQWLHDPGEVHNPCAYQTSCPHDPVSLVGGQRQWLRHT